LKREERKQIGYSCRHMEAAYSFKVGLASGRNESTKHPRLKKCTWNVCPWKVHFSTPPKLVFLLMLMDDNKQIKMSMTVGPCFATSTTTTLPAK
jgi:hypothetical protein